MPFYILCISQSLKPKQDAVGDHRICPWCCHLVNSTKYNVRVVLAFGPVTLLCENMIYPQMTTSKVWQYNASVGRRTIVIFVDCIAVGPVFLGHTACSHLSILHPSTTCQIKHCTYIVMLFHCGLPVNESRCIVDASTSRGELVHIQHKQKQFGHG